MNIDLSKIKYGDIVAVALSGGEDSVFLLYNLLELSTVKNFKVCAINVEHGIRGEESLKDSMFVKDICLKLQVPLHSYSVNAVEYAKENKLSLEQAARKLRYDCFYDLLERGKCNKIATAHHLKDNAESVLFNLFRGSGQKGLGGILPEYDGKIIRPILSVEKQEITAYLKEKGITFVTDSTNFDTDYTRNFIRLELLPKINQIFPKAENSILKFSEIAREDDEFICSFAEKCLTYEKNNVKISLPQHPAVLKRASIIAMKSLGITKDWEKAHLDAILALAKGETGKSVNLKRNVVAVKEYDTICIYKETITKQTEKIFNLGETEINGGLIQIKLCDTKPVDLKSGLYGDLDKIPKTAVIRFFKNGDKFTKFGGGTKSLSDFFTDMKIPVRERRNIPLIAQGDNVLLVFGIAVSDKLRVDKSTNSVIQFNYKIFRSTNE